MIFKDLILDWYRKNKRPLPWRLTDNPYIIWVSEVVFQQTRISQGMHFYLNFIKRFSNVDDLARADQDEILKYWQGLGYYSRARNLHYSAKYIVDKLHGVFPNNYMALLDLKGVGPYIAAEIASICFNEVVPAIDGNVQRVMARFFGVTQIADSHSGVMAIRKLAHKEISTSNPGDYNQALMDFGSAVCRPKNPDCKTCVLQPGCWAYQNDKVMFLPLKKKKKPIRNRFFNYLLCRQGNGILIHKRAGGDIWQGLFQPPLMESMDVLSNLIVGNNTGTLLYSTQRVLTHQCLSISFWVVEALPQGYSQESYIWVNHQELSHYPVPKSIEQLFSSIPFISLFDAV